MKQKISVFIQSIFDTKGKTKINILFDVGSVFLFFATFLSIPMFSFRTGMTFITWVLSIVLFLFIAINLICFYKIKVDLITFSLSLFLITALLSSLFTGFRGFRFTPLLLNIVSIIIYTYCASNKSIIRPLLYASYISTIVFVIYFVIEYRQDFFSFNGARLGTVFGDQNDISIFLALAYSFSVYYIFFSKPLIRKPFYWVIFGLLKPFYLLIALISVFCGALSGSKIFIFLVAFSTLFVVIAFFGKKGWFLSAAFIFAIALGFVLVSSLPIFSMIKDRFLSFISTLFGVGIKQADSTDGSTIERFHLFVLSLKMFLQKPIFGYGVNGFANYNGMINGWSHNNIGEFLADFGIIGTFLFHLPLGLAIVDFVSKEKKKKTTWKDLVQLKSSEALPYFMLILFFIVCMISVAFIREKVYSYLVPLSFAFLTKDSERKPSFDVSICKNIKSASRESSCPDEEHSETASDQVLYFGNFDLENGFAAANRAIGNSIIFNNLGYSVKIYATNTNRRNLTFFKDRNITFVEKPFRGLKNYIKYRFYIDAIDKNKMTKIVVLYNMPSIPFYKILKYCNKRNIIVLSDVTEWYDTKGLPLYLKPIRFIDTSLRMCTLNKKVDGIIVISDFLKEYYCNKCAKPILKIYPIMDYSLSDSCGVTNRMNKGNVVTFGYIGNNRKGKDEIDNLLPLFKNIGDRVRLIYIGNPSAYAKKVFGSAENINFIGKLSHEKLTKYYLDIDFNITIRKNTRANNAGFPTKFAESICYMTPVVCNSFSDTSYIIQTYGCGLMISNPESFEKILNDEMALSKEYTFEEAKTIFKSTYYVDALKKMLTGIRRDK